MNSKEFIAKLQNIVDNHNTVYMWGTFGSPVSESIIRAKSVQYPSSYSWIKQAYLRQLIGKGYYGFDCIGMIKAILWGWAGDPSKTYGGAIYASNGVPDISADGIVPHLIEVSKSFVNVLPGEAVWMEGHIGIYIGDGKVIECTPAWKNGVQVTACLNMRAISGLNGRLWTKHGKLPYIDYETSSTSYDKETDTYDQSIVKDIQVLCNTLGCKDMYGRNLVVDGIAGQNTQWAITSLPIVKQGATGVAVLVIQRVVGASRDGQFGPATLAAVRKWQGDHGLVADGIVGPKTWLKMANL